ncbi:bromodomain-containing protein DDB_G0270170 [Hyalella azteca]|uniref:Bromodomain-containing protein DDB_G0270170 n=1 Tax=Hyalella azteca TaxID=294128 RepID=A0A8B7NE79_HYAAZ|nr:bromodomain-containing protein DDB_G0270170 [Hyalella azteca]
MAQYMALNGGALPHPALLAHGGLPLPPHPAAPWTQPLQQPHGHPEMAFKASPHPEAIARSLACRASYDEVLKQLDRFREDQNRSDRILGLDREERENLDRETPSKANGYGDADVLNLSSKSDSHEDLSEAGLGSHRAGNSEDGERDGGEAGGGPTVNGRGRADSSPSPLRDSSNSKYSNNLTNFSAYNHHTLLGRHPQLQPTDDDHEKEEGLSDNDDFDDKNDTSDHDDFDFTERSFKSPLNNNNQSTNNNNINGNPPTSNGGLLGLVNSSSGGSSNSSSSSTGSIMKLMPTAPERLDERLHPLGLPLGGALMGLGLGAGGEGVPSGLQHSGGPVGGAGGVGGGDGVVGLAGPPLSSLENLLGNIQNLLKVATESVRHEERQKEQLRTEFLRQKDIKERLEKQLVEDEKQKELYQRRLKRERRARRRLEEELTEKLKRLSQYEPSGVKELLKTSEIITQESRNAAVAAAMAAVVSASGGLAVSSPSLSAGGHGGGNGLMNGGSGDNGCNNGGSAAVAAAVMAAASGGSSMGVSGILTSTAGGGGVGSNNMGLHLPQPCVTSPKKESHRHSPKSSPELDVRPPPVSDAAASLFFSKSMLFNCTA